MRFLLSIHDVWPGNLSQVAGYLARLRSLGARKTALLIVPEYRGAPPMDRSGEFTRWLREESAAGTELFLHGFRHRTAETVAGAVPVGRRSAWGRWVNRSLVAQEAEFCGLSEPDRERLLEMGIASFGRAGLPITGFTAPTWHGSPQRASLRGRGLGILETRFQVTRVEDGSSRWSAPLTWNAQVGMPGRALSGGEAWLRLLLRLPLIKVAIHPGDLENAEADRILRRVFEGGRETGYAELFSSDPASG